MQPSTVPSSTFVETFSMVSQGRSTNCNSGGLKASNASRRRPNVLSCKTPVNRITLNVGGRKFIVKKDLFDKFPNCVLSSHTIGIFYDKKKREHFFDRDPDAFKYIVEYCKTGRFHVSNEECFSGLLDELDFFNIPTMALYPDTCCEEHCSNIKLLIEKHSLKKHKEMSHSSDSLVNVRRTFREKVWDFTSNENSSLASSVYSLFIHFLTVMSAVVIAAETVTCKNSIKCGDIYPNSFFIAEVIFVATFTVDYLVKVWSAPKTFQFLRSFLNVIDVLALVPFYLTLILKVVVGIFEDYSFMTILRLFRVFRIMKLAKRSKRVKAMIEILDESREASSEVLIAFFGLFMVLVVLSTVIFFLEQTSSETPFSSIPETLWYTAVTITSLGYGDLVPVTTLGKFFGIMTIIVGFLGSSLLIPVVQMKMSHSVQISKT